MHSLLRALDGFNRVMLVLLGIGLMVITAVVFWQVVVRFVLTAAGFDVVAAWTEELARYVLIWMIFIGGGLACRRAQLLALDALTARVPAPLGNGLRYLALALSIGFFVLIAQTGIAFMELGRSERSPVMQVPMHWVYAAIPVGSILMIVNTLALILDARVNRMEIRTIGGAEAID